MPDVNANQPLVNGHGPFVQRSHAPPPPAAIAHAQPTTQPNSASGARRAGDVCSSTFMIGGSRLKSEHMSGLSQCVDAFAAHGVIAEMAWIAS